MSKQVKRKITVNLSPKTKSVQKSRPSVFERLGTKAGSTHKEFCHHWAQNGTCPYGKSCKYSTTHTLISPSKQRLAKSQSDSKKRHPKENAHKRLHSVPTEEWEHQWNAEELEDADADDLEKRRIELQRELELQMKMESKAHKKQKKVKKESSPSSDSSSSSSESSSSSDESSSSSSTSVETRRKKTKKVKKRESSSSSEHDRRKHKGKVAKSTKSVVRVDKKKVISNSTKTKVHPKSPPPAKSKKLSQTPPPKIKTLTPVKNKVKSESKSPRPPSHTSERKDKHRTPSPKNTKEKEREREKEKEREKEREREREKERERDREKERERERDKERHRIKERDKDKKKERSPKRESRPPKDLKVKKDSPDSSHSRDRKISPTRSRGSTSSSRRDIHKAASPPKDRRYDKRADSRSKDRKESSSRNKDKRDSRDRERDREKERRLAREEREAAREKEREEALARCQERQRERERLKELAKKDEERRAKDRSRRDDRGLDKPSGDRIERLLPLPQDRIPPARKESIEKERQGRRSPRNRSRSRKSHEGLERNYDRSLDRNYDRDHDRDYMRIRDDHRQPPPPPPTAHDEKRYDSPYDRTRHEERRFMDIEHYSEDRTNIERTEYTDDRRPLWDERERDIDNREVETRRYRDDGRGPPPTTNTNIKSRDQWSEDYQDHEWDRNRRPQPPQPPHDWEGGRENWENRDHDQPSHDDDWRHYNRPIENWGSADERRRWNESGNWRDRDREVSRPRSATSHREDEHPVEGRRKELQPLLRIEPVEPKHVSTPSSIIDSKKDTGSIKRPAETAPEEVSDIKKLCIDEPLADDLSEISDDADEILNRVEEILEVVDETITMEETEVKTITPEAVSVVETLMVQKIPSPQAKEESIEEENMDLDFEEISEDELEEEARIKGLGDALGVDWASLVAESKPRTMPMTSAKRRWESTNVLVNSGVSVLLAGDKIVEKIYKDYNNAKNLQLDSNDPMNIKVKPEIEGKPMSNGMDIEKNKNPAEKCPHPIAGIQIVLKDKQVIRKNLFASAGPFKRALTARRDLMIRRHLCNFPLKDTYVEPHKNYDSDLFKSAVKLFQRSL